MGVGMWFRPKFQVQSIIFFGGEQLLDSDGSVFVEGKGEIAMAKGSTTSKRTSSKHKTVKSIAPEKFVETTLLKLTIELVPGPTWYSNLRGIMPQSKWDKLRKRIYVEYNNKCGICGAKGRLSCHEIWEYDDSNYVQKLIGFIALCDWCHYVKHLIFSQMWADTGHVDYEKIIEHFMKVNGCEREVFETAKHNAFELFKQRGRHKWQVDFGEYENLVEKKENEFQLDLF